MTPCYILKRTFTKVNLLNNPNNWRGAISQTGLPQNSIATSPLPHYNDTVLYFKTDLWQKSTSSIPPTLGGLSQETGPPQNFTPSYNDVVLYSKTNFNKSQPPRFPQHLGGVGLSHKPDYHKTLTSTFPLTIMWCYISKRSFTNVNLLNSPNSWGGGGYLTNRTTTKLHLPSLQWCRATF